MLPADAPLGLPLAPASVAGRFVLRAPLTPRGAQLGTSIEPPPSEPEPPPSEPEPDQPEPPPSEVPLPPGQRGCGPQVPLDMECVPGGPFLRGSTDGKPDELPVQTVTVSPFFMDRFEVDNAHYERCVRAGACEPPVKRFIRFSAPRQPVVAVSWFMADAYCRFVGKRLPTEAEWEKAARGEHGERFPWGNAPPTCARAVYEITPGEYGCGTQITADVGSRPVGRYGLYDMAGNSWEWVEDWYTPCYDGCPGACGAACRGPDPRGPCGGGKAPCPGRHQKALKGGSWYFPWTRIRGAERRGVGPANLGPHRLGFRCAESASRVGQIKPIPKTSLNINTPPHKGPPPSRGRRGAVQ